MALSGSKLDSKMNEYDVTITLTIRGGAESRERQIVCSRSSAHSKDLVKRFGKTYPSLLLVTLNTKKGETFYSWTPYGSGIAGSALCP
jgi:hypothetical protein